MGSCWQEYIFNSSRCGFNLVIFRPYVRHPCWRHESLKHVRCTWFPQRPKLDPKTSIDELYSPFQTFLAFFFEGYPKHFHGKAHQRALALKGYPITPYQTLTSWTQDHFVSIFSTFLRDKEPRKGMGRCFAFTCTKAQFFLFDYSHVISFMLEPTAQSNEWKSKS